MLPVDPFMRGVCRELPRDDPGHLRGYATVRRRSTRSCASIPRSAFSPPTVVAVAVVMDIRPFIDRLVVLLGG